MTNKMSDTTENQTSPEDTKTYHRFNGVLHRLWGPAVEWADGTKEYWVNGRRHRLDGPAIEWADGTKEYWVNGRCHRLDGPAVEWADGTKDYYLFGKKLKNVQEYEQRLSML